MKEKELESQKKFKTNERIYYVRANGEIVHTLFNELSALHLALLAMGNVFKNQKRT